MSSYILTESELCFNFHALCEKGDEKTCQGLKAVDFIVEKDDCLYFIEVKNFEQSIVPEMHRKERQEKDYKKLTDNADVFPLGIGMKVKDSFLKRYAEGKTFNKKIVVLLIIKFSIFEPEERSYLYDRIKNYIPTGLADYTDFQHGIKFDMPTLDEIKEKYGFDVTPVNI